MRYNKGSFITVPSREALRGLHPIAQTLYMWLCAYANETGKCFPSRNTLSKDVGCSENSVDRMLDLLCEKGLVSKKRQMKDGAYTSNLYTVLIVAGSPSQHPPYPLTAPRVAPDVRSNSIQLTKTNEGGEDKLRVVEVSDSEEEKEVRVRTIPSPYSVEATIELWAEGELWLQVLNWYFTNAGLWSRASTKFKLQALMARHSNAAKRIAKAEWSPKELSVAKSKIVANPNLEGEWTLETVEKYLTK